MKMERGELMSPCSFCFLLLILKKWMIKSRTTYFLIDQLKSFLALAEQIGWKIDFKLIEISIKLFCVFFFADSFLLVLRDAGDNIKRVFYGGFLFFFTMKTNLMFFSFFLFLVIYRNVILLNATYFFSVGREAD